jgi:cytidylate kinase
MKKLTIAIDGFSSSGKSTMAKDLARTLGYTYVDSGAMYRAVTLYCRQHNLIDGDNVNLLELEKQLDNIHISFQTLPCGTQATFLNGENVEKQIRSIEVSNQVSPVSAIDFVRRKLVEMQREMGKEKGIVMDGRDIGTVVFPDAELKIFVNASPEVRAKRRYDEMQQKGEDVAYETILENVKKRDFIDQNRTESPLRKAEDAIELNNDNMTLKEQQQWIMRQVKRVNTPLRTVLNIYKLLNS